MGKTISVRIFPDGTVQAETHGIKGKKCNNYLKVIEEILQAKTVNSEYTDEYYQTEEQIVDIKGKVIQQNKIE